VFVLGVGRGQTGGAVGVSSHDITEKNEDEDGGKVIDRKTGGASCHKKRCSAQNLSEVKEPARGGSMRRNNRISLTLSGGLGAKKTLHWN